ncbi:MAG TPA: aminotransferase class V-fold PLP-dependent enzyme [Chryseosolibacter sp.]|nr:aminotransferase class V-fold PLP-dependent enzyme [Chryseosolibacter sp.]
MISFYPGPSKVHESIPDYVKDAYKKGVLSINHRSESFTDISQKTIRLLKQKLDIPEDFTVLFTSSATECWEIIGQSLVTRKSYHVFNGAFGEKWYEYTKRMQGGARAFPFGPEELMNVNRLKFGSEGGIICVTQNETSNGTQVSNEVIGQIKQNNPDHLIAIDATSSMGGITLDFVQGDIWFASVQKCFGLPAGLGLMICSPAAVAQAVKIDERKHYNSMPFMLSMMEKWQTPFTPNVLGIYLLMRVMDDAPHISDTHKKTVKRYEQWRTFLGERQRIRHVVANEQAHSYTVIPVTADDELVEKIKSKAKKRDLLLGEGYGNLKSSTFRIANFPQHKKKEIKTLQEFLSDY